MIIWMRAEKLERSLEIRRGCEYRLCLDLEAGSRIRVVARQSGGMRRTRFIELGVRLGCALGGSGTAEQRKKESICAGDTSNRQAVLEFEQNAPIWSTRKVIGAERTPDLQPGPAVGLPETPLERERGMASGRYAAPAPSVCAERAGPEGIQGDTVEFEGRRVQVRVLGD